MSSVEKNKRLVPDWVLENERGYWLSVEGDLVAKIYYKNRALQVDGRVSDERLRTLFRAGVFCSENHRLPTREDEAGNGERDG